MKHTGEPWEASFNRKGVVDSCDIIGSNGEHIATLPARTNTDFEANAALIAAAPDLLAACEASFDFLDCDPEETTIERADRLFEQLRKAIAKAKGEAK